MNEPQFTPGPWRWADWNLYPGDTELPFEERRTLEANEGGENAITFHRGDPPSPRILNVEEPLENPANMRLIAAAPDLFRELQHLVSLMEPIEQTGLNIPGLATLNAARGALAKALGQT